MKGELPTIDEALDELGITLPRTRKLSCPDGQDSDPSLHVYQDGWYCFHCGKSGDGLGLIAFLTGQDVRRLMAERLQGSQDPAMQRLQTRGLKRGDVHKAAYLEYRAIHTEWFAWLHDTYVDAPLWAFEQAIDMWSMAFDDVRDRMLGHGVYDDDGPQTPFEVEKTLRDLRTELDVARPLEEERAKQTRDGETRAAYWRRRRAISDTSSVYDTR